MNNISTLHQTLVDHLKKEGLIHTPGIEAAFRAVPRHLFLPGVPLEEVYRDQAIATKFLDGIAVSSSSQPAIMAIMLEQLQLQPGDCVLEIGAGTGYNAALMAHIVGGTGQVITIDIDEDTAQGARAHLKAAGFDRVQVVCSDGGLGFPEAAPYDRIILTVGARDIIPAWREQLKSDGRLLLPLTIRDTQVAVAFEQAHDHLASISINCCGFMLLRGAFAETGFYTQIGPEPGLYLGLSERRSVDKDAMYQLLTGPHQDMATSIQVKAHETYYKLSLWLALQDSRFCRLNAEGAMVERHVVPDLFRVKNTSSSTIGLFEETSLCVCMRPPDDTTLEESFSAMAPFVLFVRSFGPDNTLAQQLVELVTAWDAAGRPGEEKLHIKAYSADVDYSALGNEIVIPKQWTRFVLNWQ